MALGRRARRRGEPGRRRPPSGPRCEQAASGLLATRPTAVNLRWALDEMRAPGRRRAAASRRPRRRAAARLLARAQAIHDDDIERCLRIGEHGARAVQARRPHPHALQRRGPGHGRLRHGARRHPLGARPARRTSPCWVDETRPWLQGARLTAWELQVEGIPYQLISDNMAGLLHAAAARSTAWWSAPTASPPTATRPTRSAPTACRVLAKEHAVPFYVAAPLSHRGPHHRLRRRPSPSRSATPAEVTAFRGHAGGAGGRARAPPGLRRHAGGQHLAPSSPRPACCGAPYEAAPGRRLRRRSCEP